MTQERLTVRKIKEILRLKYEAGLSNRVILLSQKDGLIFEVKKQF